MITSRAFKHTEFYDRMLCSIAAAVLGAGALSAGATAWGASNAADAQTSAAQASIANQRDMYAQNKNMLSPFINAGASTINPLQDWLNASGGPTGTNALSTLLKLNTPGADQSATLSQLPGYQFSTNQGTRAALNALAARGLGGSPGAIAKGVGSFVSGNAQQYFNSDVANLQNVFNSGAGALQGLVNTGAQSGAALAGVGTNTANSISGSLTGAGNANAAASNAIGGAVGGLGSSMTTAALLQQLQGGGGSIYGSGGNVGSTSVGGNPLDGYTGVNIGGGGNPYYGPLNG